VTESDHDHPHDREITPGFWWIGECGPDRSHFVTDRDPEWYDPDAEVHIPQNAYLLDGGEHTLLFDTLSPATTDRILEAIDRHVDRLDYLVVSHPDVPHAGNAPAVLEAHPEAELLAPAYGKGHDLYHLGTDEATHVCEGDRLDLGGYEVRFHEATFPDAPVHCWLSEVETGTLFPVDWFGYPHTGRECLAFADELEGLDLDRLVEFHGRVLFWFQYVDPPTVKAEIERLTREFDPEILAPAHGNVLREDAVEHMRRSEAVVDRVSEQGRVGTLG
jgi:flavorubredoxin